MHSKFAGKGAVDRLEGGQPVLAGAVEVRADGQPVRGAVFGLVTSGDLHLRLDWAQRALPSVVRERHPTGEVGEAQHLIGPLP